MLKAVCLDEKEHKYLIDFIEQYKDENNRANVSSAIRFLMIKGFEALYGTAPVNVPAYNKSKINIDEIKKEVLNDINKQLHEKITYEVSDKLNAQLIENNTQLMNVLITALSNKDDKSQQNFQQQMFMQMMHNMQQPIVQQQPVIQQQPIIQEQKPVIKKKESVDIEADGLLANLLSNANR